MKRFLLSYMKNRPTIEQVSDLLLDFAVSLMDAGTHTSRVARNVGRIAGSFGYRIDVIIFQKTVMMTLTNNEDGNVRHTAVKKIKAPALNFNTISQLSSLSWEIHDERLPLAQIRAKYDRIVAEPRISRWVVLGLVACANASFCRLFGGDPAAMALVFAATLTGFFIRQEMTRRNLNHLSVFVICAFVSALIAGMGLGRGWSATPEIAIATSVLYLIPGVPLINAVIDLIEGYVLAGTSRMINACSLIICIAIGLSVALSVLGIDKL